MTLRTALSLGAIASLAVAQSPIVGDWRLDSTSGFVAVDNSANGHLGTLAGFTNDPAQWIAGRFGNALAFDGVDDRVEFAACCGIPFFTGRGEAFTVCLWVRGSPADGDRILALASTTQQAPLFALGTGRAAAGTTSRLELIVRNDQGIESVRTSSRTVFDGAWHHVAYVESAGIARLYVDGVLDPASFDDRFGARGSRSAGYGSYTFDKLALGAVVQATSSAHFAGALDDIQVYRCALSAIDITAIVAGGRATTCRASVGELGQGCGPGPFELFASGDANLGGDGLVFWLRGGQPGALAYLGIGAGPSQALALDSFGLVGCTLYAPQPEFAAIGRLDASGSLNAAPLPIPDSPSLSCSPFVLQALGASPFALELSNAVAVTPGSPIVGSISESFADETYLDREVSSGTWRSGLLTPGVLGGSGRHGSFRHQLGTLLPGTLDTWVIDTGNTTVPRAWTLLQTQDLVVTDGHFEFTDLVVPTGVRVWFRGPHPAVIHVSGRVQILGTLCADGEAPSSNFVPATTTPGVSIAGQPGARGGAGGGAGGRGADGCDGRGALPSFTGRRGDDAVAPAGSGYTSVVYSSGGPGGALFPVSGLNASIAFSYFGQICGMLSGGGGGGSFLGIGSPGVADISFIPGNLSDLGPATAPGSLVPFVQRPANVSSLDHFLVAGSGGGGGGSQPLNMLSTEITAGRHWNAGGGGGGGGGALALRCGYSLAIASTGRASARGNGGIAWTNTATPGFGAPSPGGGGSGGSILIQLENPALFTQGGVLDVTGGAQPSQATLRVSATARSRGGSGGHGAIRFESLGNPTSLLLGNVAGAPSTFAGFVGPLALTEGDAQSACTSRWRTSRLTAAPRWLHYRITARIRGLPVTWSDDPANYNPADSDSGAVRIWVQGAVVDANGQLLGPPGPWRSYVNGQNGRASLNLDGATGLRFLLVFNRAVEQDIVVRDVDVLFAH